MDSSGSVFISDAWSGLIREVSSGTINTVAGNTSNESLCGVGTSDGDGGSALSADFACPTSVRVDANGNLYVSDPFANTIRVVNLQNSSITVAGITIAAGDVDRIAGVNGFPGYSGNGGPATSAQLSGPNDAAPDAFGNVYISDTNNDLIRKVDSFGTITDYAGIEGAFDYYGDGGPATSAALWNPGGVVADSQQNIYVADVGNNAVRKVSPNGGLSSTDFGSVSLGSSTSQAITLYMNQSVSISSLQASGDFSIVPNGLSRRAARQSHSSNSTGRQPVSLPPLMAKLAQEGLQYRASRPAPKPKPEGNVPPPCTGSFAQGDTCVVTVRFAPTQPGPRWFQLSAGDNTETTYTFGLTGTGLGSLVSLTPGIINTPAGQSALGALTGMVRDDFGNTYVADYQADVVLKIDSIGTVTVVAGIVGNAGYDGDGGPATSAHLNDPLGLGLDSVGDLYIADAFNNAIRKVDTYGIITTIAGNGTAGYSGDGGLAANAQLFNPLGVLVDKIGNMYIADTYNNVVRLVDQTGKISTIAGDGTGAGTGNWGNGPSNGGWSGDGAAATLAELNGPTGLALDASGELLIADTYNSAVRKIASDNSISTVAGSCSLGSGCQSGYSGDGGVATSAELNAPFGIAVDPAGDFYVADTSNSAIRKVDVNGVITTIAFGQSGCCQTESSSARKHWKLQPRSHSRNGDRKNRTGSPSDGSGNGDGGLATLAVFGIPVSVVVDNNGNFYFTDVELGSTRVVSVATSDMNFGTTTPGATSDAQTVTVSNTGNVALHINQLSLSDNFGWATQDICSTAVPLAVGAGCSLVADFAPPSGGTYSGTIIVSDDAFNQPHTITLEGVAEQPDYSLAASPTSLTIAQGQTGTATLTVTPVDGYSGTIQFACSGLPAHSSCAFSPTSAVFTSNTDPITVTLTVTTTGTGAQASLSAPASRPGQNPGSPLSPWFIPAGLASVVLFGASGARNTRSRQIALRTLFAFALLTGVVFFNACGSVSHPSNATPVGTYSTTVTTTATANGGGGQHTAAITITIVQ